uniref:Dual oxidase maturation factor 1 n=1 Tax=Oryctolagus cuniculus TaxID=9986 RepID=A0A5F9D5M9_RABIT
MMCWCQREKAPTIPRSGRTLSPQTLVGQRAGPDRAQVSLRVPVRPWGSRSPASRAHARPQPEPHCQRCLPAALQQNGGFRTHVPLLCWRQANLPNRHQFGRHHHHLPDCTGHFHRHPARHPGQDAVNFSSEWSVGQISTNTTYKAFSSEWISADVGLQIGLGGVNITLTGTPVHQLNETISYNEELTWRLGEHYEEAYAKALEKGLPDPVLYLAEKFTPQSPCGLHYPYRQAGHYVSAMLWVAFLCWLLANVMLSMPALVYGGHMLLATGISQLLALLIFSTVTALSPPCPLRLGTAVLHTRHGPAFWITLTTGLLCVLLGLAMLVAHRMQPHRLKAFFNQSAEEDPLQLGPAEGGLLIPRYRSMAESPEPQDIALSEASSEVCCSEVCPREPDCAC